MVKDYKINTEFINPTSSSVYYYGPARGTDIPNIIQDNSIQLNKSGNLGAIGNSSSYLFNSRAQINLLKSIKVKKGSKIIIIVDYNFSITCCHENSKYPGNPNIVFGINLYNNSSSSEFNLYGYTYTGTSSINVSSGNILNRELSEIINNDRDINNISFYINGYRYSYKYYSHSIWNNGTTFKIKELKICI